MVFKILGGFVLWAVLVAGWVLLLGFYAAPGVAAAIDRGAWPLIVIVLLAGPAFGAAFLLPKLLSHCGTEKTAETGR